MENKIEENETWDLSEIFGEARDLINEINEDDCWDLVAGDPDYQVQTTTAPAIGRGKKTGDNMRENEKQLSIRVDANLLKKAKVAAKMERQSFNAWVNTLIESKIREIKQGKVFNIEN